MRKSDSFDDRFEELDAFGNRRNAHGVGRLAALDRGGVAGPSGERRARDGFGGFGGPAGSGPPCRVRRTLARRTRVVGSPRGRASDFAGSAEFTRDGTIRVRIWIRTRVFAGAPPRERFRQARRRWKRELVMPPDRRCPSSRWRRISVSRRRAARARSTSTARWSRPTTTRAGYRRWRARGDRRKSTPGVWRSPGGRRLIRNGQRGTVAQRRRRGRAQGRGGALRGRTTRRRAKRRRTIDARRSR